MRRSTLVIAIFTVLTLVASIVGVTQIVHATDNTGTTLVNPLGGSSCSNDGTCLSSFLKSILEFVVKIGSIVVVLMIVYVGYKFVAAQGEPAKITEARNMLLWTIVGALILLGAQAIATGIEATIKAISTGS